MSVLVKVLYKGQEMNILRSNYLALKKRGHLKFTAGILPPIVDNDTHITHKPMSEKELADALLTEQITVERWRHEHGEV